MMCTAFITGADRGLGFALAEALLAEGYKVYAGSIGLVSRNHQYGYTMSKAAINMQSKLLHNHLSDQGLRVLTIHPGWMRTHLFGIWNA
jgi:NAD(P)-dependent dehydrogenase (short-subunit alcohol dehydrogenase family)